MRNYIQPGDTVTLTAPANLESGEAFAVGGIFGVAAFAADSGDPVEAKRTGIFELPKTTGEAWTAGQRLYWNAGTKKLTTNEGTNLFVGAAAEDAIDAATTGRALLAGTIAPTPASPPPPPPPGP